MSCMMLMSVGDFVGFVCVVFWLSVVFCLFCFGVKLLLQSVCLSVCLLSQILAF